MSLRFYERFLTIILLFQAVLVMAVLSALIGFAWFLAKSLLLYWAFVGSLEALYLCSFFELSKFRNFREDMSQGLLIPGPEHENNMSEVEPLEIDVEGTALKACLLYRNGESFEKIKDKLELSQRVQAKRLLLKGLDILLKEHNGKVKP